FFLTSRRSTSILFPYTTLFRSTGRDVFTTGLMLSSPIMECPRYVQLLVRPIPVKRFSFYKRGTLPVCHVHAISVIVTVNVYGVANCQCCPSRQPEQLQKAAFTIYRP